MRQPRSFFHAIRRSIGERATTASEILCADVGRIALPGAQEIGAHRTGPLALRPEHVAVDRERLLVAEQPGEIGRAVLALETVVADHRAAGRQRPPLGGDALDMTAQLDLLGEQRGAGGAILGAFVGDSHRVDAGEFGGGFQECGFAFMQISSR